MRWGGYEASLCNSELKRAGLSLLKGENSWDVLCSHIHTLFILHAPHAPLKQSALSVEQWSIKRPLIMALYSLLLDVNFNLQSLIQFPFSGVAGSAPKGQDNEGRGRKSPQAGTAGVWRGSLGIPILLVPPPFPVFTSGIWLSRWRSFQTLLEERMTVPSCS